jgi:hypothetical protein
LKDIFDREGQNLNRTTKKIFKTTSDCVFCVLRILNENGFNVAFLLRQCFKILKSRFFVFFAKKYPIIPIFNDVALANKFSFYRV